LMEEKCFKCHFLFFPYDSLWMPLPNLLQAILSIW
jgi:hypothetical protein